MLKKGLNCNYFSKAMDRGLKSKKSRVSLAKGTGRTGIFGSGSSDRDLTVWIQWGFNLIAAVDSGSDGAGGSGRRRRRESPEFPCSAMACEGSRRSSAFRQPQGLQPLGSRQKGEKEGVGLT